MARLYKTPGVYVEEKNAFPNSVVEVATAVPVFIGYTEIAKRGDADITGTPTRISSFAEFERYFGGAPETEFQFKKDTNSLEINPKTRFLLFYSIRLFFDNGGGDCWIVSVGSYKGNEKKASDLNAPLDVENDGPLMKEMEPTMVVVPDAAVLENPDKWQLVAEQSLKHCSHPLMKNRVSIIDVYEGYKEMGTDSEGKPKTTWENFQGRIGADGLDYGVAYYPWVNTTIVELADVNFGMIEKGESRNDFFEFLRDSLSPDLSDKDRSALVALISEKEKASIDTPADMQVAHRALMSNIAGYAAYMEEMQKQLNLIPPSAGMAGVYARVDASEGVFKAPANTSMASVVGPAFNISHSGQQRMNVPLNGRAVNAIRTFPGKGILVWGARTLDGNSQDWRYISVRRTMIMLEQSIKYAAEAYVFAPNNASTWVTVRNMLNNYLENKRKEGALVGAKPEDAYQVNVGLGSTMTADDILNGYMLVSVKVAVVRPAEFIVITFQQKMQTS